MLCETPGRRNTARGAVHRARVRPGSHRQPSEECDPRQVLSHRATHCPPLRGAGGRRGARRSGRATPSPTDAQTGTCDRPAPARPGRATADRKSTRLNSSHVAISYAVFCLKKKKKKKKTRKEQKKKKKKKNKKKHHKTN